MTHYSFIWINVTVKLAKSPATCFVVVVSGAIIFLQELCESKFKITPYVQVCVPISKLDI